MFMSPINALPFDVFQIVIMSCWKEKGESFVLTASHVCRLWRRHVLDMPLLWNRLEFATDTPKWDKLEAKLVRSGRAPLDIIVKEEVFLKSGMPHLRRIMRMVGPHIERWKSLRLVDVPHKIRRVLLDQLRGKCVPVLHRVEVVQGKKYDRTRGRRIKSTSPHWDPRRLFVEVSNLRHLEWTNPESEYRLLPPFQNLLTLKVGPGTLDIEAEQFIQLVFRILSASPALQVLSLSHGPDSDYNDNTEDVEHLVQPPTTHSSLQLFQIVATIGVRDVILRSLILPKLRSLGEPIGHTEITTLCCKTLVQSNSTPGLRGVAITGGQGRGRRRDPALNSHTPSLPSAFMSFQDLVVVVFRLIDFGGNNKWLPNLGDCCPRLKSLTFLYCTGHTVKAIQAIVETRIKRKEIQSLEELRIYPRFGVQDDVPNAEEGAWFSRSTPTHLPGPKILVMSPIDSLPFDVFQLIIMDCGRERGESSALAASHVCHLWRHRVLDMPLLWNRLVFATNTPQWDKLEVKLERSGQAPLDIVVKEEVFLKSGMPHLRRIMRIVVPHIERWRSLRMVDVPHKIRRVLLDQLRGKCLPGLDRVEVVQGNDYDRTWGRRIKSTSRHWDPRGVFVGVSSLRHLEWTNPEAEYRLLPSFQNLLTLKIGPDTLAIDAERFIQLVFRILSASPALQVLSLSHGAAFDYENQPEDLEHLVQSPATQSSLEQLHIAGEARLRSLGEPLQDAEITTLCCKALVQSKSAPGLRGVVITGSHDGEYHPDPALNLHTPSLPSAFMSFQDLVVAAFRFIDFGGNSKWLPNLGDCCPRLKSLTVLWCTGYTVKAIQAIVEARMNREDLRSLEELRIYPSYGKRDDVPSHEEAA
ncbi:hypothetical protein FRC00_010403, partial [Tulasnella sp. 408]